MITFPASRFDDPPQATPKPGRDPMNEQDLLTAYCLENEIPFLPTSGLWSVPAWSKFLQQEEKTVRDWVKTYKIQHKGTTKSMFIDAEHMRESIPVNFLFEDGGK